MQSVLAELASESGVVLSEETTERLECYLALLERWGARMNLTGDPSAAVVRRRQLPDAFQLAGLLGPTRGRAIDAGAGAGLVSIPLALLLPGLELTLVESSQRKCAFLREAAHALGLGMTVSAVRVETVQVRFPLALSRATWAPGRWAEVGRRIVERGGRIVVFSREPPALAGLEAVEARTYQVADTPRCVSIWRCP